MTDEPYIVINRIDLSESQCMAVRVAIQNWLMVLETDPDHLGEDEMGRRLARAYRDRLREVNQIMSRK